MRRNCSLQALGFSASMAQMGKWSNYLISVGAQAQEPILMAHDFHITESGRFLNKTFKEMETPQFEGLAKAACQRFGINCSREGREVRKGSQAISSPLMAIGGDHYITGRVTRHEGPEQEWYGIFDPLNGYEVCNAYLDYDNMSITGMTTFNATIYRRSGPYPPGLAFYAVVRKDVSSLQWVDANLVIAYVPNGTTSRYNCVPDQTHVWECKGKDCSPISRL